MKFTNFFIANFFAIAILFNKKIWQYILNHNENTQNIHTISYCFATINSLQAG